MGDLATNGIDLDPGMVVLRTAGIKGSVYLRGIIRANTFKDRTIYLKVRKNFFPNSASDRVDTVDSGRG